MTNSKLYRELINQGFSGDLSTNDINIILDFIKAENERLKEQVNYDKCRHCSYGQANKEYRAKCSEMFDKVDRLEQQLQAKDEEIARQTKLKCEYKEDCLRWQKLSFDYNNEINKQAKQIFNLKQDLETNTHQVCEKIRQNSFSEYELVNGNKALYFTISSDELDKIERGEL